MTKREQALYLSRIKQIDITTAYTWLRWNSLDECLKKTRKTKSQAAKLARKAQGRSQFRLPGSPVWEKR
ncbi:MAG: hypothetical protein GY746_07505 [Gammaproteobacteria bacterium]|nr:hypothetical protein [Gammaproteobacteria bacterium]